MCLDAKNLRPASATPAVVRADAWQETCGLERVVLCNFIGYGLELQHGYGGAAYLPLRDIEIFAGAGALAGIYVHKISEVGAFQLSVDGATIAGASSTSFSTAIHIENDTLHVCGLHVEGVRTAIAMAGSGCLSVDTVTGSFADTVDILHLLPTFTGKVSARVLMPNGAKGNTVTCEAIPQTPNVPAKAGNVAEWVYPPAVPPVAPDNNSRPPAKAEIKDLG
jgi:hypothetical protein